MFTANALTALVTFIGLGIVILAYIRTYREMECWKLKYSKEALLRHAEKGESE